MAPRHAWVSAQKRLWLGAGEASRTTACLRRASSGTCQNSIRARTTTSTREHGHARSRVTRYRDARSLLHAHCMHAVPRGIGAATYIPHTERPVTHSTPYSFQSCQISSRWRRWPPVLSRRRPAFCVFTATALPHTALRLRPPLIRRRTHENLKNESDMQQFLSWPLAADFGTGDPMGIDSCSCVLVLERFGPVHAILRP